MFLTGGSYTIASFLHQYPHSGVGGALNLPRSKPLHCELDLKWWTRFCCKCVLNWRCPPASAVSPSPRPLCWATAETMPTSLYNVIGVARTATATQLRKAYHGLARKFHPDKHNTAASRRRGERRFKTISAAYSVLSDPVQRSSYDAVLDRIAGISAQEHRSRSQPQPKHQRPRGAKKAPGYWGRSSSTPSEKKAPERRAQWTPSQAIITGLTARTDLNGMRCTVAGYDRVSNRYLVDVARRKVTVRPACLVWPVGTAVCINGLVVSPEHKGRGQRWWRTTAAATPSSWRARGGHGTSTDCLKSDR